MTVYLQSRTRAVKSSQINLDSPFDAVLVRDVKNWIRDHHKIDVCRQRLTTSEKKVLDDDRRPLSEYQLKEGDPVIFKDLGPQISWRTVFLIEYLGPLIIHPLFYTSNFFSNRVYGTAIHHSRLQSLAFGMVMIHFLKREIETVFVHRFSNATMPMRNIFKNSFHYWILSGFLLAGPIYGAKFSVIKINGTLLDSRLWSVFWSVIWAYAEISNLRVHLHLRSLRPAGSKKRCLPIGGYGFNLVACPNYLFESISWLAYTALVGFHWSGCLFTLISFVQMSLWAAKKLKNYRAEFPAQVPSHWKSIVPFIL